MLATVGVVVLLGQLPVHRASVADGDPRLVLWLVAVEGPFLGDDTLIKIPPKSIYGTIIWEETGQIEERGIKVSSN